MKRTRISAYLALSRASNLPTVWTDAAAGALVAGGPHALAAPPVLAVCLAMSLFYVGGMFLNDAFDRGFDARNRPERPIPRGEVTAAEVFAIGFGLLGAGLGVVAVISHQLGGNLAAARATAAAGSLIAAIVLYDAWHKSNPFGPILMGACRALVYLTAALTLGPRLSPLVVAGALAICLYLAGLTAAAKAGKATREARWLLFAPLSLGAVALASTAGLAWLLWTAFALWISRTLRSLDRGEGGPGVAIPRLIAGISLFDAALIATAGGPAMTAIACVGAVALTIRLQRWVQGT